MPELFAVTGKPVAHSLSPEIFALLFRELGRDAVYTRLAADSAQEALGIARELGIHGLNVTSPFKEEMRSLVGAVDEPAAAIGAVNCVELGGPRALPETGPAASPMMSAEPGPGVKALAGHNTDFIGLIGTLNSLGIPPAGCTALVLGSGGAARAAGYGLVGAGAARVIMAGRSPEKAEAAARALGCEWAPIADIGQMLNEADVCVSCLPFPASRLLAGLPPNGCPVVDAHYASGPDGPIAGNSGFPAALLWLFHQAIPSFEIMTGFGVDEALRQKVFEQFLALRPRPRRHLALVGFMGAGKTTTGRQLARLSGREFVDADETIVEVAGMRIPEIFASRGESAFRSLERSVISKLTRAGGREKVIAVGGGAVLDAANRRHLAENCRAVWLWTPARTAVSRIEVATRPVLDPGGPLGSAERTLAARLPFYAAVSDLIVNSADRSPLDVARRIKDEMDQAL